MSDLPVRKHLRVNRIGHVPPTNQWLDYILGNLGSDVLASYENGNAVKFGLYFSVPNIGQFMSLEETGNRLSETVTDLHGVRWDGSRFEALWLPQLVAKQELVHSKMPAIASVQIVGRMKVLKPDEVHIVGCWHLDEKRITRSVSGSSCRDRDVADFVATRAIYANVRHGRYLDFHSPEDEMLFLLQNRKEDLGETPRAYVQQETLVPNIDRAVEAGQASIRSFDDGDIVEVQMARHFHEGGKGAPDQKTPRIALTSEMDTLLPYSPQSEVRAHQHRLLEKSL